MQTFPLARVLLRSRYNGTFCSVFNMHNAAGLIAVELIY